MMRQLLRASCILAAIVITAAAAPGAQKTQTIKAGAGPLATSIWYLSAESGVDNQIALEHMRAAGARYVRIFFYWSAIAPSGSEPPTGFQARDPADPNYNWQNNDNVIRAAADAGLEPIVLIFSPPVWAQGDAGQPSPAALADFATATAKRYGGSFEGLPRVRYWSIWNEPNLSAFLGPQSVDGKPFAPYLYRAMLNASADAIHSVNADNIVIGGETAPFWNAELPKTAPIAFMEMVLCISEKQVRNKMTNEVQTIYKSACKQRAKFDVWAHHPYTEGGPTHRAQVHGNASLGDLGDMRAVLNAAIRANHVVSEQKIRFWVTEFSWDSKPPDPKGVPVQLEARWVSQALYQAWKAGVSLFTWTAIRDEPLSSSYLQAGLYYRSESGIASDRAKPALRAFRFPFVALRQPKNKVLLWGRTPTSTVGNVLIERKFGAEWKLVTRLEANRYGIFKAQIDVPFSLKTPKKTWTGCAFGTCV
jgi:hypothetical protein